MKNINGRLGLGSFAGLFACVAMIVPARAAITPQPQQAKIVISQGWQDLKNDDYNTAIARFAEAAKLKHDSKTYFMLGYAHYQRAFRAGAPMTSSDRDDAMATINAYTIAMTLDPELSALRQPYMLYYTLGMSYESVDAYGKALAAYKKAIATAPNNTLIPLYAARLRYQMNDQAAAAANLRVALERAQRIHQKKELISLVDNNHQFAAMMRNPANQRMFENSKSFDKLFPGSAPHDGYGIRDAVSNQPHSAFSTAPTPAFVDPAVAEQISYGDKAFKSQHWDVALGAYQQALYRDSNIHSLNAEQQAAVNVKIGSCYNKIGEPDLAANALNAALSEAPFNSEAHYQLSLAYEMSLHSGSAMSSAKK